MKRSSSCRTLRTAATLLTACLALCAGASAKTFTGRAPEKCNPNDPSESIGNADDWYHPKNWGSPCAPVPAPVDGESATIPSGFTVRVNGINLGALSLQGTLIMNGNCTIGSLDISGSGQLLSAGNWNTLTVGSVVNFNGGTIGMHVVMPPGSVLNWDRGMIWGNLTQAGGALMYIRGSGEHMINAGTFTLNGVTTWNGNGIIRQVGGTDTHVSIINKGTFLADGSGSFATDGGYLWFNFINDVGAEFIKDGGNTTTTFASTGSARPMYFRNHGTLDVRGGVFEFTTGQLVLENGSTIKGAAKTRITSGSSLYIPPSTTSTMTGTLELDGGYMEGEGTMTGNGGTFNWISGSLGIVQGPTENPRPATLNIPEGMTINIMGDGDKRLGAGESTCSPCHRQHGVINNAGTANWTGTGDIVTGWGGGSINNSGTFTARNDEKFRPIGDGGTFTNTSTGTLRKQGTSGTTVFEPGITLNQSGTADIRTGTLQANAALNLLDGSRYSGAGKLVANAGGNLIGTATVLDGGSVEWRAGLLTGGNPTITQGTIATQGTGRFDWTGGNFCGTVNVASGSLLRVNGTADKMLGYAHRWTPMTLNLYNAGTILWTEGKIVDEYGGRIHNSGTFSASLSEELRVGEFLNTGTLLVPPPATGGPYTVQVLGPILNTAPGKIDVQAGELVTKSALTLNPASVVSGAGRLALTENTWWNGNVAISGTVELRDGIVRSGSDASFTSSGSGRFVWTKGRLSGAFEVPIGSRLEISGAGEHRLGHYYSWSDNGPGTLTNRGTIAWTSGPIVDENTGRIHNYGTFSAAATSTLGYNEFFNYGTFLIPTGSGSPIVELTGTFNNNNGGILDIRAGELVSKWYFTLNTGSQVTGAGRVAMTSDSRLNGTVNVTGDGTLEMRAAILRAGTDASVVTTGNGKLAWTGGRISGGLTIPVGSTMEVQGPGTKLLGHYYGWADNAWGIIYNRGTINWTGTGPINDENTGHIYNYGAMNVMTTAGLQGRLLNEGRLNLVQGGGIDFTGAVVELRAPGSLNVELSSDTGLSGRITSHNHIGISGELNVSLAQGYRPAIGSPYTLVNRGNGQFSKFRGPPLRFLKLNSVNGGATILTPELSPQTTAAWKSYFFEDPQSPLADIMADANGDGVSNLISYAFGKDPNAFIGAVMEIFTQFMLNTSDGPAAMANTPYMAISYKRPGGNSKLQDVRYIYERSTTLAAGSWSTQNVIEESVTFDPVTSLETVVVRSTIPKGAGKEFLRVRIEQLATN